MTRASRPLRRGGRGVRPWFLLPKLAGVVLFIGGLASLIAIGLLGPEPQTLEGWTVLRGVMRTVVMSCMLPGFLIAATFGLLLFAQHPRVFLRLRWFRLKGLLLVVGTPVMHVWARSRANAFESALHAEDLASIGACWNAVTLALSVSLVLFLVIGAIGRHKPRLGEKPGSRQAG